MNYSASPKVSIVILTYNAKSTLGDILDKAVQSALNQSYPNIEVLVVDNNSSDDTYEYIRNKYGDKVKVVKLAKNYGYCLGNNLALRYISSDSKYVLFQNPDAILSRDYVAKLIEILKQNPDAVAIQGLEIEPTRKRIRVGGILNKAGYSVDILPQLPKNARFTKTCSETLFAFGAALLIKRDIFESVGGFPSDYFLYYDEADLGFRFRALGFKILGCTHTSYIHFVSGTISKTHSLNPIILYFTNKNRVLNILKYFYGLYLIKALLLNVIIMLFHFIKGPAIQRRVIILVTTRLITKHLRHAIKARKIYARLLKKRRVLEKFFCHTLANTIYALH
jgi:GT2 family glycosyltransferase